MDRALCQRIFQYVRSLFKKDSWKSIEKSHVLFFSDDVHHSSVVNSLPFSPLLDRLASEIEKAGLLTQRVGFLGSRKRKVFGGADSVRINRKFVLVRLTDWIRGLWKNSEAEKVKLPSVTRFFSSLLTESEAKVVIAVGAPIPLALAAHNTNTHMIEILHGFGYSSIPWDYMSREPNELPHEVWVGDPLSHRTFSQLGAKGTVQTFISPLQLESPPEIGSTKLFARDGFEPRNTSLFLRNSHRNLKKVIFATSRGGRFGKSFDTVRFDWKLLDSLISNSSGSILWFFRFHPIHIATGHWSSIFRKVIRLSKRYANCDWEWISTVPPSISFKEMDSLLTWGSEVVFDAHYSGLNSGVITPSVAGPLDSTGQNDAFDFLAERGSLAYLPPDTEKILDWVLKQNRSDISARRERQAKGLVDLVRGVHSRAAPSGLPGRCA